MLGEAKCREGSQHVRESADSGRLREKNCHGLGAVVELISLLLSPLGIGREQQKRVSDQRAEVARLNAEVAAEAGRALDILEGERTRILRRCAVLYSDGGRAMEICKKILDEEIKMWRIIVAQAEENSKLNARSGFGVDWDLLLQKMYEWRANARRLSARAPDIIRQFDSAMDADEERIRRSI